MSRRIAGCRCKRDLLTCWKCVEAHRFTSRFDEMFGASMRAYYQPVDPFEQRGRHWMADDGEYYDSVLAVAPRLADRRQLINYNDSSECR